MGQSYNDDFGYGFLILQDDNDGDEIFEFDSPPDGLSLELVGDLVLGTDQGIFLKVKEATVMTDLNSGRMENDYVTEFATYDISDVDPEVEKWLQNAEKETGFVGKLGVFKVGYFG